MKTIQIRHLVTSNLDKIIQVPLSNTNARLVVIDEADWDLLQKLRVPMRWRFIQGKVVTGGPRRLSLARIIMNASKGESVQFVDGNPFNLRRKNLILAKGGGRYRTRDRIFYEYGTYRVIPLEHVFETIRTKE